MQTKTRGMRDEGRGTKGQAFRLRSGQALVELAVFGMIFLMILGALISYGLKFSFQQQAQQEAFRRALAMASNINVNTDTGSGSYMLMRDRHIPDPMDMFGIGASAPISASASVTRTYNLDSAADDYVTLPTMVMDLETDRLHTASATSTTSARKIYKTGGFRVEYNVVKDDNVLRKYGLAVGSMVFRQGSSWISASSDADIDCSTGWTTTTDADGNPVTTCSGTESYAAVRFLDSCAAEVIDYASCYKQAILLVDTSRCITYCQMTHTETSDYNCTNICNAQTNPPNQADRTYDPSKGGAWYADNYKTPSESPSGRYEFPNLDALFSFVGANGLKSMSMQSDSRAQSVRNTSLEKIETTSQIQTDESFDWSDTTNKTFVTHPVLDTTTGQESATDIATLTGTTSEAITTKISGSGRAVWTTDK